MEPEPTSPVRHLDTSPVFLHIDMAPSCISHSDNTAIVERSGICNMYCMARVKAATRFPDAVRREMGCSLARSKRPPLPFEAPTLNHPFLFDRHFLQPLRQLRVCDYHCDPSEQKWGLSLLEPNQTDDCK